MCRSWPFRVQRNLDVNLWQKHLVDQTIEITGSKNRCGIVKQQQLTLLHNCRAPMFTSWIIKRHRGRTKIWGFWYKTAKSTKSEGRTGCVSSCWTVRNGSVLLQVDLLFTVLRPARESCIHDLRRHYHCLSSATKFRPVMGAQGLWTRRGLYRVTPACDTVSRFFRSRSKARPIQSPLKTRKEMLRTYSILDPHRWPFCREAESCEHIYCQSWKTISLLLSRQ
jgi:hypothetical protein